MPAISLRKKWSDSNTLDAVLAAFNESTSVNEEGAVSFNDMNWQQLLSLLDDAFNYPNVISARELSQIIYRSVVDARKLGEVAKTDLMYRINSKATDLLASTRSRFRMWTYMRLNWNGAESPFRLKINNVKFSGLPRLPTDLVVSDYDLNGVGKIKPNSHYGFGYIVCSVDARNEDDAARQIFEALDIFWSLANAIWSEWNIFGGEHHAEAKFWNGPYQFFFKDDTFLGTERLWFSSEFSDDEWNRYPKKRSEFDKLLPTVRNAIKELVDHPLRKIILRALKLLNDGMTSKDSSYRLLRYWSALEVLFSSAGGTKTSDIILRSLFADKYYDIDRLKLDYLSRLRNQYVHEGLGNENVYYLIQFLRDHVRKHVFYLTFHGADFKNHEDYLAMCDLPHDLDALKSRREAIARRELIISIGRHKPLESKRAKATALHEDHEDYENAVAASAELDPSQVISLEEMKHELGLDA